MNALLLLMLGCLLGMLFGTGLVIGGVITFAALAVWAGVRKLLHSPPLRDSSWHSLPPYDPDTPREQELQAQLATRLSPPQLTERYGPPPLEPITLTEEELLRRVRGRRKNL